MPLAESVVFAMLASFCFQRTLVPTMAKYLLRGHEQEAGTSGQPILLVVCRFCLKRLRFHLRERYQRVLEGCLKPLPASFAGRAGVLILSWV